MPPRTPGGDQAVIGLVAALKAKMLWEAVVPTTLDTGADTRPMRGGPPCNERSPPGVRL